MTVTIEAVQAKHHESGFGLRCPAPPISWRYAASDDKDWKQVAYEIGITHTSGSTGQTTPEEIHKVESSSNTLVPWPGPTPLKSRDVSVVRVRALGSDQKWTEWKSMSIETGLMDRSDWKAKLVGGPAQPKEEAKTPFRLRKTFTLSSIPKKARIYATAHGVYELEVNGQHVGDQVLAPGWTSYHHYLNFQTYDVTSLLKQGENTIGVHVAAGWFAGRLGRPGKYDNFGDRLGFMGQLEIEGKVILASDGEWEVQDSPIAFSDIYDGEHWDSNLEDPTWSTTSPSGQYKVKGKAEVFPDPKGDLYSTDSPPVRKKMEIKAKEIITTPSGRKVIDFGQNLVGWLRLEQEVEGKGEIVIRHAEVMEHGELGVRPLRTAKCTDKIVLGGKTKGWEPKFTFHGFRYAEITGMDTTLSLSSFTAIVIFSDMRPTGTFTSSHKWINQLHENTIWGMRGNFVSVPTDCPQRDERLGWTGDLQVFAPTANYLYDTSGFLEAWFRDVSAETFDFKGVVPTVVPFLFLHRDRPLPQAAWADCIATTPWDLWENYGDKGILEANFDAMMLWIDKGVPRGPDGLWEPSQPLYGDWLDPRAPPQYPAHGQTDTHMVANAYLVHVTHLVSKIAKVLGKKAEAEKYTSEYHRVLNLFNKEYVSPNGRLAADTQTAFTLALKFGLLDGHQSKHAAKRLEHLIRYNYFKIATGFAGTPVILPVLAEHGLLNVAYRMLQEKDNPSWLYPVSMGATTIWERWDSMLPDGTINPGQMTSFNHYAYGSVAHFLHSVVGGLSSIQPGWTEALIRPRPGGTITSASTSYSSPIGTYAVSWKLGGKEGEDMHVDIEVPPNGQAKVVLPGVEEVVGSGKKSYEVIWKKEKDWPPKGIPGPQSLLIPDEFVP